MTHQPATAEDARIYFIRHGETAWSLTRQHTGVSDIPLTAHGEDQARKLRAQLRPIAFSAVMSSPRARARRTCDLADLTTEATIDPDLAE